MLVTAVTTTAVATAVALHYGHILGGTVLILLIGALISKEITKHSGKEKWGEFHRLLSIATVPLAVAAVFVVIQQIGLFG